jgi:predicted metal-dependent peptidase
MGAAHPIQTREITPEIQKAYDKAKIGLMAKQDTAFFTTIVFSLKLIWDWLTPTAATDGSSIRVSPEFFMSLDPEERIFLLVHESMHVALLHMTRLAGRNHQKWNIACDHYINLMLTERGFRMPRNGLADPQYKGLSSDEIYPLLPDQPQSSTFQMDLELPTEPVEELTQEVEDILIRAAMQSKMQNDKPGSIPGDIEIFLNKLLNPKLPWQRILQKYIQNLSKHDYSWRKPNRRFFPNHYLPSMFSEKLMDIAIAVDASGSVSDDDFKVFVSETHGILKMMKPDKITLIQFDRNIKSVDRINNIRDLMNVKFIGRGGTSIEPVMDWAAENKPKLLLIFTDGGFYFHTDEYKTNTVFLIHNNPGFTSPYGKVIHYEI